MLFVAMSGLQNGLLGALLTFAGRPLYVGYLHTTAVWGLTPLEDQQLSGLIMWIPASLIHLAALCVVFVVWMHAAERRAIKMCIRDSPTHPAIWRIGSPIRKLLSQELECPTRFYR